MRESPSRTPRIRKSLVVAAARDVAARLVRNMEVGLLDALPFSEDEFTAMHAEMVRIADKIAATVNEDVLAQLGTPHERTARELAYAIKRQRD